VKSPQVFEGIAVSDRAGCYAFIKPSLRQVCWAPLIRDFNALGEWNAGKKDKPGACASEKKLFVLIDRVRDGTAYSCEFERAIQPCVKFEKEFIDRPTDPNWFAPFVVFAHGWPDSGIQLHYKSYSGEWTESLFYILHEDSYAIKPYPEMFSTTPLTENILLDEPPESN